MPLDLYRCVYLGVQGNVVFKPVEGAPTSGVS